MKKIRGAAIGDQRRPFHFQMAQLGTGAFGQQRRELSKGLHVVRLASAVLPAQIGHRDHAEEGAERRDAMLLQVAMLPTVGWHLDAPPRSRYHIRNARVAQWIERLPPEQKAVGSSPSPRTSYTNENG